jgi:hypothetical protein
MRHLFIPSPVKKEQSVNVFLKEVTLYTPHPDRSPGFKDRHPLKALSISVRGPEGVHLFKPCPTKDSQPLNVFLNEVTLDIFQLEQSVLKLAHPLNAPSMLATLGRVNLFKPFPLKITQPLKHLAIFKAPEVPHPLRSPSNLGQF